MKRSSSRDNYNRGRWQSRRGWYGRGVQNIRAVPNDRAPEVEASQSRISGYFSDHPCPYKGWKLYFPNECYLENNPKVQQIKYFEQYLKACKHLSKTEDIENRRSFTVDFNKLTTDEALKEQMPQLEEELVSAPKNVILALGLAMHQLLWLKQEELKAEHDDTSNDSRKDDQIYLVNEPNDEGNNLGEITGRLVNYDTQTPLSDLQASYYGKLVTIKGTVVRVGSIEPFCTQLAFQCTTCSEFQGFHLKDGKFKQPEKCISRECRGRTFTPQRKSCLTKTVDWQKIRVQEMNDARQDTGRVPRTVECELMRDLVDSCVPGDVITLTGIVKVNNSTVDAVHNKKDTCLFTLYIEANSIANSKGIITGQANATSTATTTSSKGSIHAGSTGIEFSLKDLYAVREIHEQKNLFYLLVHSLCPAIYGHEMVKAGLLLGLFGGAQKYANVKGRVPIRGDLHVLVVGDPGLGKSQMLQACAHVSPRGVYICGNTTTTAGLTVTLTKDGGLEAGALVLSDHGCCCIDEFDKMGTEQQALLEAMEQQCISIAKAGIVCSLPARTAVLAAANPVGGHYNKGKTVSENLKFSAALLSRFDLVFILLDQPDEEMDSMLSKHVMALHAGMPTPTVSLQQSRATTPLSVASELMPRESGNSLSERLKIKPSDNIDHIPHQLLSKYIGYAREYVHPKITQPAVKVLQTFYLDLRKRHQNMDSTPITTRQLESLIRLSEARARLELREEATAEDANDVVEIMKYSMVDTYSDLFGVLDFQRSQHGSGLSSRSLPKKFISILTQLAERTNNSLFTMQQLRDVLKESNLNVQDFEGFIESLNNHGFILKKGPRLYQLQTVE